MHIRRVKGCLYVLYSISASGDLLKTPAIHFFQYWMNDCINHECISVLLSQMFPPKFCANNRSKRWLPLCEAAQPRSLFLRRLKSFAERHNQLWSSRNIQNPSTFRAKSFMGGRTERSDEDGEVEDRNGVRGGESKEVPLCKDRGTGCERRVCSSPAAKS